MNLKTYRSFFTLTGTNSLAALAAAITLATPSAFAGILVAVGNTILEYDTNGTLNGTFVTLPTGDSATGMTESGGDLYIAANNGSTGLIYKYEPDTSTLTVFATPGLGTPIQQIDFASDGKLYFAIQSGTNAGIWRTDGGAPNQIQSNVQNTIGLTASGDGKFVIWGYAGPQDAASLDGYGDISTSPGVFNLVGPTGNVVGLANTGNYYTPTALTSGSGGFIAGVYAGSGKTLVKTGVNYANAGSTLWEFGNVSDNNNQINGLTLDPSGNLYVCVSTQGNSPAIYSFVGQTDSPTLIASVAGAGNILYFSTSTLSAYSNWAISKGLNPLTDGAPDFDKDADGATNLQEYAFFTEPNSGSSLPSLVTATDSTNVTLTYQRGVAATDVTFSAESSTDLVNWTPVGVMDDVATGNTTANTNEYRATAAKDGDPAKFLRVQVTLAP